MFSNNKNIEGSLGILPTGKQKSHRIVAPSSSGLGRCPFKAKTGVQFSLELPKNRMHRNTSTIYVSEKHSDPWGNSGHCCEWGKSPQYSQKLWECRQTGIASELKILRIMGSTPITPTNFLIERPVCRALAKTKLCTILKLCLYSSKVEQWSCKP